MAAAPAHAATAAFAGLAVPRVAPGSAPLRRPCKEGTERHSPLGTGTGAGDTAMRRVDGRAPVPGQSRAREVMKQLSHNCR